MFVKSFSDSIEIIAGDGTKLRELFSPLKNTELNLGYSFALATVEIGNTTFPHKLTSSEVYYILSGRGLMSINGEEREVEKGDSIYIPPNAVQNIKNIGENNLDFICIVDPAWKIEDEEILN